MFSLTGIGDAALDAWLHRPVTCEELVHHEGASILRFSLAGQRLARRELLAYLDSYRAAVQADVEELEGYLALQEGEEMLVARLSLELGIAGFRSTLEWTLRCGGGAE